MKRLVSLSASLFGLALSPIASAQDTAESALTDPNAAPAQPAGTISAIAPPPPSDTATKANAQAAKKADRRPFAGSSIALYNSLTTATIFKGQQQDYNPTVESTLWLLPRYAFNDAFQLRARALVNYEYTNSDTSTYRNEPQLTDTTVQLFYRKIPMIAGIQPYVALNAAFPTSKLSRSRTMIFTPGATLQLTKPVEHVLGGELLFIASAVYSHPVYKSPNAETLNPRPAAALQCMGGPNCTDILSGTMNVSDVLTYALIVTGEWGKWSPAVLYFGGTQWTYSPSDVRNPIDGTPIARPAGFESTTVRQTHYFSALLDYNVNSWFTAEVGYWNSTSVLAESGRWSNPFFNRYQDARLYAGISIQLDNLVKEAQGGAEGEAGVVRAHNTKRPIGRF